MKTINKLEKAYKTISEVAEILNLRDKKSGKLSTHTIRFWEKNFKQIKPKVFNSIRRYYDQRTINLLIRIKYLLKDKGMTIQGVKNILNNKGFDLDERLNLPINVPKLEIFIFLCSIKFSIILSIISSNRLSAIFFEKPICI